MAVILLVDDEPEIRFLTRRMLEKEGHEVMEAANGSEAMERLNKKPDLILLDVMMPHDDGWEICRKLKGDKETTGIPVVMFTIRTSPDSVKKSYESGADGHINKPFDMQELLGTVERLLEKAVPP